MGDDDHVAVGPLDGLSDRRADALPELPPPFAARRRVGPEPPVAVGARIGCLDLLDPSARPVAEIHLAQALVGRNVGEAKKLGRPACAA